MTRIYQMAYYWKATAILFSLVFAFQLNCNAQFPVVSGDSLVLVEHSLKKINKNISFTVIPGPVYGATDKLGFFILPMIVYDINKKDSVSPPSSTALLLYFDFYGSWQLGAKQNFYWNQNKWRAFIKAGVGKMQMRFFGIGGDTAIINNDKDNYSWITTGQAYFSASCYRKVVAGFYAGLEYDYTYTNLNSKDSAGAARLTKNGINESENVSESVLIPTFAWDNRDNIFWSTKGYFATLNLQISNELLFSSAVYSIVTGSVSGYHNLRKTDKRLTLAWHFHAQLAWGDMPYPRYANFGVGDHATGYTKGKYVNRSEFSVQAEVRYDIWKFIGAGGYLGTGKVFPSIDRLGQSVWLHYGGIRGYINIIPSRNLRLLLDLAFGRQDWGFYVGMGQAF